MSEAQSPSKPRAQRRVVLTHPSGRTMQGVQYLEPPKGRVIVADGRRWNREVWERMQWVVSDG